jgi:hypothetical protein
MDRRLLSLLFVTVTGLGLSACGGPAPLVPPGGEAPLRLSRATPSPGTALAKGSPVELDLEVASSVGAPGLLTLSIRDQNGATLLSSDPSLEIPAGGTASFDAHFLVPATASSVKAAVSYRPRQMGVPVVVLDVEYPTR